MRIIFIPLVVFAFCLTTVHAEEWKSSDGLFSFIVPNGFVDASDIPTNEIELQHWIYEKDASTFYVLSVAKSAVSLSPNFYANPKRFVEESTKKTLKDAAPIFAQNAGVSPSDIQVVYSDSGKTKDGFVFLDITLSATDPNHTTFFLRNYTVCISNKAVYALGIATINENPIRVQMLNNCVNSISVHATPADYAKSGDNETSARRFADWVDRALFICLLTSGIAFLIYRSRRAGKAQGQMTRGNTSFKD